MVPVGEGNGARLVGFYVSEHELASVDLHDAAAEADCVAIVTAHSGIDYDRLVDSARLVVDFRNATGAKGTANGKVWKL